MAVGGIISPPTMARGPHRLKASGEPFIPIGTAGVVYNARPGCPAFGWAGDHLEPAVCVHAVDPEEDHALHYLANLGNDATVVSGEAKGARGRVLGEHARFILDFSEDDMRRMCPGDRVQITAWGTGLELLDYPHIRVWKLDPRLLDLMGIEAAGAGVLRVPVTHILPSRTMGSGWELNPEYVDQDICSNDPATVAAFGLETLRTGDVVAVTDAEHWTGRGYREGAMVVGVINHGNSWQLGHGPGCMTVLSCRTPHLQPVIDPGANIARYLGAGVFA
ncbi:MAG: DUF4438 domain-containing protein [Armatimonadota bacterium]|nr:DUF4438 domain-containing protein [Armatimonadota bacterium]